MARSNGKTMRPVNAKAINYSGYFRGIGRGGGAGDWDLFSMDCWKSGSAAVPFDLEGRDAANRASGAFENALFDALAEGGGGEDSLLSAGNHGFFLEAALGAAAQDQWLAESSGSVIFFTSTRWASERSGRASRVSFSKKSADLLRLLRMMLTM